MNMISITGEVKHALIDWSSIPEIYTIHELHNRIHEYNNLAQDQTRLYRRIWMDNVMSPNTSDEYEYYGVKVKYYHSY